MTYPADFRYTKEHEWIKVEGGVGTIGLTDHAQHELGDIVLVDLPKVGTKLSTQQTLGTVESVKAVSEIFSPVSGEVTEVNEAVASAPEKVNQDPHGDGWLLKLRLANLAEVEGLMNADQYADYIQQKAG